MNTLKLKEMSALAIDCQATHSNPASGHLTEIGWVQMQAAQPFDHEMMTEHAKSYLGKLKKNAQLPRQFLRITGIQPEEMKEALSKKIVWQKLYRAAKKTAYKNHGFCPSVIHFRRYEEPYLIQLHQEFAPHAEFPFTVICTHEIVSRLYPGLPRKGLRAAAGFFGFSLPNLRRSLHHVLASAFIWHHVVRILEEKEHVSAFGELQNWLSNPPGPIISKQYGREYPMDTALRQDLPDKPGIYKMYRSTGDLLYIGKAKSLKHRINSYFQKRSRHAEHILEMLSQARNLSTSVTDSALEAAVRESDEIKLERPPYNRTLQSNERQLLFYSKNLKSKKTEPNSRYPLGPFPSNINMISLSKLIDVLNGKIQKITPQLIESLLDAPPAYAPDEQCFRLGLDAFCKKHCDDIPVPVRLGHVMKWGMQFWEEKLLEKELEQQKELTEDTEKSLEDEEPEGLEEGWTPDRVLKALKRVIRMDSFQMRRARWFCRLSESTLFWSKAEYNEKDKHVLLIERGVPSFRSQVLHNDRLSSPKGHPKSEIERKANFDIATYDRMRIITTEMRRIIQEGRDVSLSLYPGKNLNKTQLIKILKWV